LQANKVSPIEHLNFAAHPGLQLNDQPLCNLLAAYTIVANRIASRADAPNLQSRLII